MNNRNFYAAVSIAMDGKEYATVWRFSESENIAATLNKNHFTFVALCPTKKKAAETADFWNDCYRANGAYLFDGGTF